MKFYKYVYKHEAKIVNEGWHTPNTVSVSAMTVGTVLTYAIFGVA